MEMLRRNSLGKANADDQSRDCQEEVKGALRISKNKASKWKDKGT